MSKYWEGFGVFDSIARSIFHSNSRVKNVDIGQDRIFESKSFPALNVYVTELDPEDIPVVTNWDSQKIFLRYIKIGDYDE